jgi:hypothetical protein
MGPKKITTHLHGSNIYLLLTREMWTIFKHWPSSKNHYLNRKCVWLLIAREILTIINHRSCSNITFQEKKSKCIAPPCAWNMNYN